MCGARGNNHRAPHRDLPSFSKIGCFAALYLSFQLRYPCNGLQPKLRRLTLIAGNLTSLETGCILLHWYLNADHIHLQKAKFYRMHLNADEEFHPQTQKYCKTFFSRRDQINFQLLNSILGHL